MLTLVQEVCFHETRKTWLSRIGNKGGHKGPLHTLTHNRDELVDVTQMLLCSNLLSDSVNFGNEGACNRPRTQRSMHGYYRIVHLKKVVARL